MVPAEGGENDMSVGALLWASLRELVVAVGRRLIGKLLRGIALRWAVRRLAALRKRFAALLIRRAAPWRLTWANRRIAMWDRVRLWTLVKPTDREALCECSKIAKREGIPMDSPDDVEPKRAPRKAA
jgi:hypothetical protein